MERRICRKCLLRENAAEQGYVERYLFGLPEEVRTEEEIYEERLAVCQSCSLLLEAMCRSCGCYVELRAAVKGQVCPYKKWKR